MEEAFCPQSVTICLEHDIDVSRGDMIVGLENLARRELICTARLLDAFAPGCRQGKNTSLKHIPKPSASRG